MSFLIKQKKEINKCNQYNNFFIFFFFRSGSGKTTLSKEFVIKNLEKHKKLELVLVNSDPRDFKNIKSKCVGLQNIDKVNGNKIIIVEDIISVSKKEEQTLRLCLNKYAHHKLQKYFFISHSIFKTSMYGMLPFFNYIVLVKSETNLRALKDLLKYFRLEENQVAQIVDNFVKICRQYPSKSTDQFFYFSTHLQQLYFCDSWQNSDNLIATMSMLDLNNKQKTLLDKKSKSKRKVEKNDQKLKLTKTETSDSTIRQFEFNQSQQQIFDRFDRLTSFYEKKEQAKTIFSFILPCLDEKRIRLSDLTIVFNIREKKEKYPKKRVTPTAATTAAPNIVKRLSLLDYIADLLDENKPVPPDHKVLHQYLKTKCIIPSIFIVNKELK